MFCAGLIGRLGGWQTGGGVHFEANIDNMLSKLVVQVVQTHNIQLHGCEIRHKYGCGDIYG